VNGGGARSEHRGPAVLGLVLFVVAAAVVMSWAAQAAAQFPPRGGGPPPTPRASAPIDLTGVWVSIVNEDWRWRMITAPRGDFPGLPLSPAGRAIAMAWDPKTDGSCQAFGAAAVMRMPTRVRISWADDATLKIETDNGQQTRLLHFAAAGSNIAAAGPRTLQGYSVAEWQRGGGQQDAFLGRGVGAGAGTRWGGLKVVTTNTLGGWLRSNGVPYGQGATVTEQFTRFTHPVAGDWFVVTTVVEDPQYLTQPFITSSNFKKESNDSKFKPAPCKAS